MQALDGWLIILGVLCVWFNLRHKRLSVLIMVALVYLWRRRHHKRQELSPVTAAQIFKLKGLAKEVKPQRHRRRQSFAEQMFGAATIFSESVQVATEKWSAEETINLACRAYAQDAITIDELERIEERALKHG